MKSRIFLDKKNQYKLNTILILCSIIFCFIIYALYSVLLPFIVGAILSYFLSPLEHQIRKIIKNKSISAMLALIIAGAIIYGVFRFIAPVFYTQLLILYKNITSIDSNSLSAWLDDLNIFDILPDYIQNAIKQSLQDISTEVTKIISEITKTLINSTSTAINFIMILILAPFTAYYLLKDAESIKRNSINLIPTHYKKDILYFMQNVDSVFLNFLKGQCAVSMILGVYYISSFYIIKFTTPISLGVIVALFTFIPYAGTIISVVLILLLTFLQFGTWYSFIAVSIIFGIGHFLEIMILAPKLLGNRLGLHPLITIISVLVNAKLFGFIGMFFALPLTVLIIMIIKLLTEEYSKHFVKNNRRYK